MCSHEENGKTCIDFERTCELCGECNIDRPLWTEECGSFSSQDRSKPRNNFENRRLINFRNIMNKKSGKQSFRMKPKEQKIISDVMKFIYGLPMKDSENYNERKIRDTLRKLRLLKYINDSYLILCILTNKPCEKFDKYEPYFEYMYQELFDLYSTIYPYKYFISGAFILSCLLNEVGIESKYYFKNIETFENQNQIYKVLRKQIPMTYDKFTNCI
jgi:hypothetical protein